MRRLVIYLCYFMMMWACVSRSPSFGRTVTDLSVEEVPPKRLAANLEAYLKRHLVDDEAYYELGRVYCLMYASSQKTVQGTLKYIKRAELKHGEMDLPDSFYNLYRDYYIKSPPPPKTEQERYLSLSLKNYKQAVDLTERSRLGQWGIKRRYYRYLLGYAWMLEQGIKFAKTLPAPFTKNQTLATEEEWRRETLDALREVYRDCPFMETHKNYPFEEVFQIYMAPAWEAAMGIIRLEQGSKDPEAVQEVADVKEWLKIERARDAKEPHYISPIIFPLNGHDTLSQLLAPRKAVRFDLMGDRTGTRWSWVNERAGILVWDPLHTGRVRSGYQLFGNVTWCMIWKHGYAPLARLDANGDGWLTGAELESIAVWRDKNGNGVSDTGEVVPLSRLGIARISVKALQGGDGVYWNPKGIVKQDGTAIPTYDWIAKEAAR